MHPAKSIVFFTTASGAGYGCLAALALVLAFGPPVSAGVATALFVPGFALVVAGLLSSLLHLGHPERAWRALTQWRTSWLSREGCLAVLFFVPAGLLALTGLVAPAALGSWFGKLLAILTLALALATVHSTAMIYASLKAVPAWHSRLVPALYLAQAAATGLALLAAMLALTGAPAGAAPAVALFATALAALATGLHWNRVDTAAAVATSGSATGLGAGGEVRMFEAPHTEANYILKEMGFRIVRRHAVAFRAAAAGLAYGLAPVLLWLGGQVGPGAGATFALILAFFAAFAGTYLGRWLFFAEAKHVVMLFYGARRV